MRDPDLVFRAQLAAAALESAWHRWRVVHGLVADPMPMVSSYVGYSLEEPWGQPRVVFGLAAEDAEQLATLLERHDCVGPVYATVATLPGAREPDGGNGRPGRFAPLAVPRQSPSAGADQSFVDQSRAKRWARELLTDLPEAGSDPGEPVFRQAAAAMREAAEARPKTERPEQPDEKAARPGAGAAPGSLAEAASAARTEAEARIRAVRAEYRRREPAEPPATAHETGLGDDPFMTGRAVPDVRATDILRPLPRPGTGETMPIDPQTGRLSGCLRRSRRDDLRCMDAAAVLAAFDEQVRRAKAPDGTGAALEVTGKLARRIARPGVQGSGITWSDLDYDDADAVIAEQIAFFAERGQEFEWKLYDYDKPADLAGRLLAAGFAAREPESFVVAEVSAITAAMQGTAWPQGVVIERVRDQAGVAKMTAVQELVFGEDRSQLLAAISAQLEADQKIVGIFIAMAGDLPVSAARIEFLPDTEFAGLWGGGTLPTWRGRGIYRALVRRRAELAAERGYRYLTVDASPDSWPILDRLGFTRLAITTPCVWSPGGGPSATS